MLDAKSCVKWLVSCPMNLLPHCSNSVTSQSNLRAGSCRVEHQSETTWKPMDSHSLWDHVSTVQGMRQSPNCLFVCLFVCPWCPLRRRMTELCHLRGPTQHCWAPGKGCFLVEEEPCFGVAKTGADFVHAQSLTCLQQDYLASSIRADAELPQV